ncbi:MAG: hypothetical protein ABWY10_04775 [Tardiphaga sp.]|jgi:hypothetical protein
MAPLWKSLPATVHPPVSATAANAAPAQKKVRELPAFELLALDLLVDWEFNFVFDLLLGLVFGTARP